MINHRQNGPAAPTRFGVNAVVKWFNPTKGFGFVKLEDGSPDAFIHLSVIAQAGYNSLNQGDRIVCDLAEGRKGMQVASIHQVEEGAGVEMLGQGGDGAASALDGTVKFFNADKGFGFITPDDGSRDVFVSARTLQRLGLTVLETNQRVRVTTRMGQKGPMAETLDLI